MSGYYESDVHILEEINDRRKKAEAEERAQVAYLRERGCPWSVIGDALQVSKQAAHHKFRERQAAE